MTWRACGDRAALVELDDLDTVLALHAAVERSREEGALAGVVDLVPAARTLLVQCASEAALVDAVAHIADLDPGDAASDDADPTRGGELDTVVIEVRYDGEDLEDVARMLDVDTDEVVRRHLATTWRAAFTGFAPGFAYLVAEDDSAGDLTVARRDEARTKVPAGAVGLAGEFSGVYPRSSPGGWQLIGHTDAVMWDPERGDAAALVVPGTPVRFEEAG